MFNLASATSSMIGLVAPFRRLVGFGVGLHDHGGALDRASGGAHEVSGFTLGDDKSAKWRFIATMDWFSYLHIRQLRCDGGPLHRGEVPPR